MQMFANRLTLTWLLLSVITIINWQLGADHAGQTFHLDSAITAAVIAFALIKMRFIMREFMEVRTAPAIVKWITDGWLVATFAVLMAAYFHA